MTTIRLLGWGLLFVTLWSSPARAEPCTSSTTCRDQLTLSTGKTIPLYRSYPLAPNDAIERVVIIVHGNTRNADDYYDRLVRAASAEDRLDDTLLLAPNFRTVDDSPAANEHYWSSSGWKIGDKSRDEPGRFSSFEAMNELLQKACSTSTFPKLQTVVITGHSAGGQFVNRYAAGGAGCSDAAVEVRYVVMNPSSYLYASDLRRSAAGDFEVPNSCPGYDEYKYGLDDLNTYMSHVGPSGIRTHLFTRRSYYLAGDEDTSTTDDLDTSCPGNLQGPNRRERHANYREYANLFMDWTGSAFLSVPGVGHSSTRMLMSETVRRIVFRSAPRPVVNSPPRAPVVLGPNAQTAP